jgi:lysophospholipase L1-like esterase
MRSVKVLLTVVCATWLCVVVSAPRALGSSAPRALGSSASGRWVGAWGASAQAAFPNLGETGISVDSVCPGNAGLNKQTVRDVVSPSVGGSTVRVRLSNAFGHSPLRVGEGSVAIELSGAEAVPHSFVRLTFQGRRAVTIPPGGQVLSDAARLSVTPRKDVLISIYVPGKTTSVTEHWDAQQDSFLSSGNQALTGSPGPFLNGLMTCWMLADRLDVIPAARVRGTVVALGDSITDGFLSDFNANMRWPNDLARRLAARAGATLSVTDEGIWGNEVLTDTECCGVSTLKRLDRDVFETPKVHDIIFLEGINDIGCSETAFALCTGSTPGITAAKVIAGYKRIINEAHRRHIRIFGATLTPFKNSEEYGPGYWTPHKERIRELVNAWIRQPGHFDGVFDFARATADPHNPQILNPIYDGGDHLHPNDAGYQAMADTISLPALLAG